MESEHGSNGSKHSSKDVDTSKSKDDPLAPLISLVGSDHESESEADIEIVFNEKPPGSAKKSKSSTSVSSSSSESSAEDFLLMDTKLIKKSSTSRSTSPKAHENGEPQSPLTDEKDDTSKAISSKSEQPDNEYPSAPSSQASNITVESSFQTMSPVQQPPTQVMERPEDFNPERIPASVFASKSSTPMDWSVASNESLFSIHIGNSSFSREQFLMMSGDLSGELYKSGELNKSGELTNYEKTPQSPAEGTNTLDVVKKLQETGAADETMKYPQTENVSDQTKAKVPHLETTGNSSSINRPSDGSGASSKSFAFPICSCKWPRGSCDWPSWSCCKCHCSNCWRVFYCGRSRRKWLSWSSCKCHWSSCSCEFSHCWKSRRKSLVDTGRSSSWNVPSKRQDTNPDFQGSPKVKANAKKTSKNWWCSWCCPIPKHWWCRCSLPRCSCFSCSQCSSCRWCW